MLFGKIYFLESLIYRFNFLVSMVARPIFINATYRDYLLLIKVNGYYENQVNY